MSKKKFLETFISNTLGSQKDLSKDELFNDEKPKNNIYKEEKTNEHK